ncbi:MAG: hypothetical protein NT167_18065, partial [Verrucomicrobia bacterium]|nr:hypothetical protein [Verrucomicrobiota bacterium]
EGTPRSLSFLNSTAVRPGTAPDPRRSLTVDNIVVYGEATARLRLDRRDEPRGPAGADLLCYLKAVCDYVHLNPVRAGL